MCEVKICGLTNADDARFALDAGADYLGFVLYERSPRGISASDMGAILSRLPLGVKAVGVFVNKQPEEVCCIANEYGLAAVQLHGDEEPTGWESMPCSVWRSLCFVDHVAFPDPVLWPAERYVVDASVPGMYGGTGVTADWAAASELAGENRIMLSGGLTSKNVKVAVETVMPYGVDVASGVEIRAGIKSHEQIVRFINEAKSAFPMSQASSNGDCR